ncbi:MULTISPECIES: penicillin-binding transpeptidase domain-containing protein, partial [unclassified Streptomyces]|uniref:penicillin-binding transpeptidase domain-containing protein n=1 Tax=unclassified Streptomyces TaxID=2593676 RepID=UPI00081E6114
MNRTIRHTAVVCLLMVLALLVRATWVQAYEAKALADDGHNRRRTIAQYAQPLGDIVVAGSAVTGSRKTDSGDLAYERTYTDGALYAPVTGYSSQAYGSTQLEGIYSEVLDGTDSRLKNPLDAILGKQTAPGDVLTSIEPAVQEAGYRALGNKKGAAVAIDPVTGRVLAVVSTPSYDPTRISGTTDGDAWSSLTGDPDKPMVNRALRQPLPPGS